MIKTVLRLTLVGFALLFVFFFGPSIGKSIYFHITPISQIEAWKSEFRKLDQIFPRTAQNEDNRIKILRELAQRGINIDDGIRDEAIENNLTPYTIFVMTCWRWEELFGI
jgi:hypothetical protein